MGLSGDELAAFVARSCAAQGVPVRVSDAGVVVRVVTLLGAGPPAPDLRAGRTAGPSQPPNDADSVRVQTTGTRDSGSDHHVVHDRSDDRRLAGEVQLRPPAA